MVHTLHLSSGNPFFTQAEKDARQKLAAKKAKATREEKRVVATWNDLTADELNKNKALILGAAREAGIEIASWKKKKGEIVAQLASVPFPPVLSSTLSGSKSTAAQRPQPLQQQQQQQQPPATAEQIERLFDRLTQLEAKMGKRRRVK
jgi:hypothetical protein